MGLAWLVAVPRARLTPELEYKRKYRAGYKPILYVPGGNSPQRPHSSLLDGVHVGALEVAVSSSVVWVRRWTLDT